MTVCRKYQNERFTTTSVGSVYSGRSVVRVYCGRNHCLARSISCGNGSRSTKVAPILFTAQSRTIPQKAQDRALFPRLTCLSYERDHRAFNNTSAVLWQNKGKPNFLLCKKIRRTKNEKGKRS